MVAFMLCQLSPSERQESPFPSPWLCDQWRTNSHLHTHKIHLTSCTHLKHGMCRNINTSLSNSLWYMNNETKADTMQSSFFTPLLLFQELKGFLLFDFISSFTLHSLLNRETTESRQGQNWTSVSLMVWCLQRTVWVIILLLSFGFLFKISFLLGNLSVFTPSAFCFLSN